MVKRVMAFTASGIMLFSLTFLNGCTIVKKEMAQGNAEIGRYQMAISPGSDGWSVLKLDSTTGQIWRIDCAPSGYRSSGWAEIR